MPVGRPSKYQAKYCQMLIAHMEKGYSYTTFAATIRVNVDTLYAWEEKHKEFSEAKRDGFAQAEFYWEKMGISGATGGLPGFNASTWIFNMKNRFKWRDKIEHTGQDGAPISITSLVASMEKRKKENASKSK